MVLRRLSKITQDEEKEAKNCKIRVGAATSCALPAHSTTFLLSHAPYFMRPTHGWRPGGAFCLFSKLFLVENPKFHLLTGMQWCTINRDSCTHFYSLRKLAVQGKGQVSGASWQRISILLLFSLGYVFLLFCNDVSFHVQLNLSWLWFHDELILICWIQVIKFVI